MKYLILIVSFMSLGFLNKSEQKYVPDNLKTSNLAVIKREFNDWRKVTEGNPKGYDEYAQNLLYKDYLDAISDTKSFLLGKNIIFDEIIFSEEMTLEKYDYKFDYKIKCEGGEKERDWWTCYGGFFFTDLKSGFNYDTMGMGNKVPKYLRKKIKNGK